MSRTAPDVTAPGKDAGTRDFRRKQRAALMGGALNLPLAVVKILVGYFGASQALVADGIDSATDIFCDALVLGAVRASRHRADTDHPYGHARIETAATTLIAVVLLLTAAFVAYQGVLSLLDHTGPGQPSVWTLVVAAASVALKEGMYWYTRYVGRRARSALLESNAWHHRSDALSSAVALAAIAGAMLGFPVLDAIGAIVIAGVIAVLGARYGWQSYRELVDTGLNEDRLDVVREQIATVPGVRRMRHLRTRTMGGRDAFADVGVLVDPYISLTEAHRISEAINERLVEHVEEVADISIHVEPDGHEDAPAAFDLPLRDVMLERLQAGWSHMPIAAHIQRVTLHYLDDAVDAEIVLPLERVELAGSASAIRTAFADVARRVDGVRSIRPLFR